ncbi:MAG: Asp-tRNA(Asn)/Glu-tRNA(Gln) amidotransferase subunit GatC [bacterium]|nr:Asp-tRNA(Asn)/Glu-tRNA(Gln) amidotransferase subunit GatC [bacterium]
MTIGRDEVEHVARLARLRLTDEERERFTAQLAAILDYVRKLNEIDTAGVEPTAHVLPLRNVTRPDEVRPSLEREGVLRLAPRADDGFIMVPRVIE